MRAREGRYRPREGIEDHVEPKVEHVVKSYPGFSIAALFHELRRSSRCLAVPSCCAADKSLRFARAHRLQLPTRQCRGC